MPNRTASIALTGAFKSTGLTSQPKIGLSKSVKVQIGMKVHRDCEVLIRVACRPSLLDSTVPHKLSSSSGAARASLTWTAQVPAKALMRITVVPKRTVHTSSSHDVKSIAPTNITLKVGHIPPAFVPNALTSFTVNGQSVLAPGMLAETCLLGNLDVPDPSSPFGQCLSNHLLNSVDPATGEPVPKKTFYGLSTASGMSNFTLDVDAGDGGTPYGAIPIGGVLTTVADVSMLTKPGSFNLAPAYDEPPMVVDGPNLPPLIGMRQLRNINPPDLVEPPADDSPAGDDNGDGTDDDNGDGTTST